LLHRDIRWPNVIRRKDDPSKWFLIDWEDAQEAPGEAAEHFDKGNHSPRIFQDGHGMEVDMWGVGHLITESGVIGLSSKLREIEAQTKQDSPPTAAEVLKRLQSLVAKG
jgi:hypothetical protein